METTKTTINLTAAELELINLKRLEQQKQIDVDAAAMEKEKAIIISKAERRLDLAVRSANYRYLKLTSAFADLLDKGNTNWSWSEITQTLTETARIYNREISDYETLMVFTEDVKIATLKNGPLKITSNEDGFASNISKDRASRYNPFPIPNISSSWYNKSYASIKKCISVSEDLKYELDQSEKNKAQQQDLLQYSLSLLQNQYPTASITAESIWDKTYAKTVPCIRVILPNEIQLILEPIVKNNDGTVQFLRRPIIFPKIETTNLIDQLMNIKIVPNNC